MAIVGLLCAVAVGLVYGWAQATPIAGMARYKSHRAS